MRRGGAAGWGLRRGGYGVAWGILGIGRSLGGGIESYWGALGGCHGGMGGSSGDTVDTFMVLGTKHGAEHCRDACGSFLGRSIRCMSCSTLPMNIFPG